MKDNLNMKNELTRRQFCNGTIDSETPRIPINYLRELFGKGVEHALDIIKKEREKKEESELMNLLISRKWHDMMIPFHQSPVKEI